ncbi:hypothetical protein GMLC_28620 [Geomonas limicola]|uniref:Chemotaxis methyl-accepting receptor HlyB-like 4HB MCP domain-containing protein n=1 Tax=Geomonas limicola TaxID=2740186 RepID=A0A6V8NCM0_9BACT|nr:MCP four helix bundle domain-containing protein [Geomonas limicola]GFO69283.1 hypothetical protein GMLC_28620 [Geomonas limicola]
MNFWGDLKVRTKMMTLVMISCLGLVLVGSIGMINLSRMNQEEQTLSDGITQTAVLQDLKNEFLTMRLDLVYLLSLKDTAKAKEKTEDFESRAAAVRKGVQFYEKCDIEPSERRKIQDFRALFEKYVDQGKILAEKAAAIQRAVSAEALDEAVSFATGQLAPLYQKPAKLVAELVDAHLKEGVDVRKASAADFQHTRRIMLAIILFVALGTFVGGFLITNSVVGPLKEVFATLRRVADGFLGARCTVVSKEKRVPSPLAGEGQGEGEVAYSELMAASPTLLPPPVKGGGMLPSRNCGMNLCKA